ncbi:MAG: HEAT repeat domain-containing protein [bacterium]
MNKTTKVVFIGSVIALVVIAGTVGVTMRKVFYGLASICATARDQFPGDNVEALMALAQSEEAGFRDRNKAIWALGQIGDQRALPLLKRLQSEQAENRDRDPETGIEAYEVGKAIRHCESKFTLTRWMYNYIKNRREATSDT